MREAYAHPSDLTRRIRLADDGSIWGMPKKPKSAENGPTLNTAQANLAAIIKHSKYSVNGWAVAHKLDQSTINRIVTGKQDMSSKKMEEIAAAARFPAWHLLVHDYVPSNPPMLRGQTPAERELYARIQNDLSQLASLQDHNTGPGDL